jgi:hypothetical protein
MGAMLIPGDIMLPAPAGVVVVETLDVEAAHDDARQSTGGRHG